MPDAESDLSPKHRLANVLLGGGDSLSRFVADRRSEEPQRSWRSIANDLRDEVDVDITPETLRSWYGDAADEASTVEASS